MYFESHTPIGFLGWGLGGWIIRFTNECDMSIYLDNFGDTCLVDWALVSCTLVRQSTLFVVSCYLLYKGRHSMLNRALNNLSSNMWYLYPINWIFFIGTLCMCKLYAHKTPTKWLIRIYKLDLPSHGELWVVTPSHYMRCERCFHAKHVTLYFKFLALDMNYYCYKNTKKNAKEYEWL